MENKNNEIQERIKILIEHLKEYNDAVVLIGNNAVKEKWLFQATENNEETYSRKALAKEPEKFWANFLEVSGYEDDKCIQRRKPNKTQLGIKTLLDMNVAKTLIDMNPDNALQEFIGNQIEYIPLKGSLDKVYCVKCLKELDYNPDIKVTDNKPILHSDYEDTDCTGKIQPTIPFYGRPYNIKLTDKIKDAIFVTDEDGKVTLNTHTLILIGPDMTEDYLYDIVNSYKAIRGKFNKEHMLIIIDESNISLFEFGPEFGTEKDISGSIERLIDLIKGE